jgi:hypothetical protein
MPATLMAGVRVPPEGLRAARTLMSVALSTSRDTLEAMELAQRARSQAFAGMVTSFEAAIGDLEAARDVQDLMAIPMRLTQQQLAHATQHAGELFDQWLAACGRFSSHLAGGADGLPDRPDGRAMVAALNRPLPAAMPFVWMNGTPSAWTGMMSQWVDAVRNGPLPS